MTAQAGAVAVVPTEPTLWMLEQLSNALYEDIRLVGRRERFRKGYAAMLAAAPTPPAAVPVEALEGLVDAIRPVASMPLEEYAAFDNAPDNKCIFGANDWNLTVGDIRRLRAALANIERLIKERSK